MQYRPLGSTGMNVSAIGLGCGMLGSSTTDYAVALIQRALDRGVNYIDVARGYRDGEVKTGLALAGQRERAYISTKTGAKTRDEAWRHLEDSLERLRTDYVDNWHMHGLRSTEDLAERMAPGGAWEAFVEAKEQGIARHVGATSHLAAVLIAALERLPLEIILVPMNIVERQPLEALIPLCRQRGVGVSIMKPLATGLFPAPLALKWLLNQPIDVAVPGMTTLEEVEEDTAVGALDVLALTGDEARAVADVQAAFERVRCRFCFGCESVCPQDVQIGVILGSDVMYDHYRTMGPTTFASFTWSRDAITGDLPHREETIAAIASCTRCGACEEACEFGLPVMDLLAEMLPGMRDMVRIYRELL